MSEILSDRGGISFNREARDLLIDACVEFVVMLTFDANELADKENKKTIAVEHIEKSLKALGFPEYVKQVLAAADEHKLSLKVRYGYIFPSHRVG